MTNPPTTLQDDISFMRALAEEGHQGSVRGGIFLAASGLIYAAASVVQWAKIEGLIGPYAKIADYCWLIATGVWLLVWMVLVIFRRIWWRGRTGSGAAQQGFALAWRAAGFGVLANALAVWIAASKIGDPRLFETLGLTALAFYGAAWLVAASATRRGWMSAVALAAFGFAIGLAFWIDDPRVLLGFAAAMILLLVLPGLRLMRGDAKAAT